MEKRKLKKMKVLEPSEEMVLAAESDIPAIGNMAYERMEYPIGLFIQAEMDENILKIGFFVTDILTAGGRRPLYTLFIDKENDCFIGYDYRLKKWTNKMLDKIAPGKLWVNPDCGLKTRGVPETVASLKNLVEAAKEIRQEHDS